MRLGSSRRRKRCAGWTDETLRFALFPGGRHDPDHWCGIREQSEERIVQFQPSPGGGSIETSEITQRSLIFPFFEWFIAERKKGLKIGEERFVSRRLATPLTGSNVLFSVAEPRPIMTSPADAADITFCDPQDLMLGNVISVHGRR